MLEADETTAKFGVSIAKMFLCFHFPQSRFHSHAHANTHAHKHAEARMSCMSSHNIALELAERERKGERKKERKKERERERRKRVCAQKSTRRQARAKQAKRCIKEAEKAIGFPRQRQVLHYSDRRMYELINGTQLRKITNF